MMSLGQKLIALLTIVSLEALTFVFAPLFALIGLFAAVLLALAILRL